MSLHLKEAVISVYNILFIHFFFLLLLLCAFPLFGGGLFRPFFYALSPGVKDKERVKGMAVYFS